ncbi:MAG: winged helix-turn-helix transcriptional regulator [Halobacteriota archaeon]
MSERGIPVACEGEDWCPIQATAILVCKKWHPVVVHRLLVHGPLGFNALQAEAGGISSKVLSNTLEELESYGIVERNVVSEKPVRVEYAPTDRGTALEPMLEAMREWGEKHLLEPDEADDPVRP